MPLRLTAPHLAVAVLATLGVLLGGCVQWTEADGSRRVVGFVSMRIAETTNHPTFAGKVIDMTTVGLAVSATGDETFVTLGYLNINTARLRDNVLVIGNPLQPITATPSTDQGKP